MAITRKQRLGSALEGFVQNFWPAYLNLQETQRRTRSDRQRFLESAGSEIFNKYMTPAQLETFIDAAVERGDFKTRDEARTALTPYMPTDEQRWAKGWSELGDDPATWTRTRAQQIMRSFGIEDPFQETFLPSRPIASGTPFLPSQPISGVTGLGQEPAVDATGKLLEPLDRGPLQQPPNIEIGELQEPGWGGPQAEMFEKIKAEALAEQRKQAGLTTEFEVDRIAAVTEAQMQAAFDFENNNFNEIQNLHDRTSTEENKRRIDGMIFELEHPRLEPLRQQIEIARLTNEPLNEAQQNYARMMNDVQLEFAVKNHAITAVPQFYYPYNLKTKQVDVYAVTFDQVQGKNVLRALDDLDMPEGVKNMLRGSAPWSAYFQRREEDTSIFRVLTDIGLDPAAAMQIIKNMQGDPLEPGDNNLPPPDLEGEKDQAVSEVYGTGEDVVEPLTQQPGETRGAFNRRVWHKQALVAAENEWIPDIDRQLEEIATIMRGIEPGNPEFNLRNKRYEELSNQKQQLLDMIETGSIPQSLAPLMVPRGGGAWGDNPRNPATSILRLKP